LLGGLHKKGKAKPDLSVRVLDPVRNEGIDGPRDGFPRHSPSVVPDGKQVPSRLKDDFKLHERRARLAAVLGDVEHKVGKGEVRAAPLTTVPA
jgi:hypothetical protein